MKTEYEVDGGLTRSFKEVPFQYSMWNQTTQAPLHYELAELICLWEDQFQVGAWWNRKERL